VLRDVTSVEDGDCIQLFDNQTIKVWDSGDLRTYKLISDKYHLIDTSDISGGGIPTNVECVTIEEIQAIPSYFDFMTPVYHLLAIVVCLAIPYLAFKLILRPFYRSV